MAEIKISQLPVATALDGTESVAVVQGGVTKKAAVSDLAPKSATPIMPIVTHDGNQLTGIIRNTSPWSSQTEYSIMAQVPPINVAEKYSYKLGEYVNCSFQYDTYSYGTPSELNVDAPAILEFSTQLWGANFTFNTTAEFIGSTGQLQGVGNINAPNCIGANGLDGYAPQGSSYNFPNLKFIVNGLSIGGNFNIINLPLLEILGNIYLGNINLVGNTNISLPALKYCMGNVYFNAYNMTSLDLSSLKYIERDVTFDGCQNLTTLIMPNLDYFGVEWNIRRFQAFSTPLNQASVDNILARLDGTGQYNGTVNIAGSCSAPSAAGYQAAQNLMNKGWSVTTN